MIRFLLLTLTLLLASCQSPLGTKTGKDSSDQVPFAQPELNLDAKLNHLQNQRKNALRKRDWDKYIVLTEQIWRESTRAEKSKIEKDAWIELQEVSISEQENLISSANPQVKAWGWLLEARQQQGLNFKRMIEDIAEISSNVSFTNHLIPELINHYQQLNQNRVIAVLLPGDHQLAGVVQEIKAGILKAYWHENSQHQLLFINSKDYPSAEDAYFAAIKAGSETVIGPLLKDEVINLTKLNPTNLVALNFINQPTNFWQFSYKNVYEETDLINFVKQSDLQKIAVLAKNSPANIEAGHKLQAAWQEATPLIFYNYPEQNPNLRFEMSKLLQANLSQERAGFLSRTLGQPLEFLARTREDLDGIILLDDEKQTAVLRPQLDYFNVSLPLFASSKLTPDKLFATPANPDLKQIIFPVFNAVLSETPVKNGLQAFGWDAYKLALNQPLLAQGLTYRGVMADQTLTEQNIIHSQMAWAKFNASGKILPFEPNKFSSLGLEPEPMAEDLLSDDQLETLRLKLLNEINQLDYLEN